MPPTVPFSAAAFVAAVVYVAWNDIAANGWSESATQQALVKAAVGLGIVFLGAFVARAQPSKDRGQGRSRGQ